MTDLEIKAALRTIGGRSERAIGVSRVHGGILAYAPLDLCPLKDVRARLNARGYELKSAGAGDGRLLLLIDSDDIVEVGKIIREACDGRLQEVLAREAARLRLEMDVPCHCDTTPPR